MTANTQSTDAVNRRLRLGMVGGGPGAFIGAVHRIAARLDDRFELVAAALSSNPERSRAAARDLHIAAERAYGSFAEMAAAEARRPDRIDAVSIVTPNHLHFAPAKAFLEAGVHVICDKPLTTTVEDAVGLAQMVRRSGLIFGLTHGSGAERACGLAWGYWNARIQPRVFCDRTEMRSGGCRGFHFRAGAAARRQRAGAHAIRGRGTRNVVGEPGGCGKREQSAVTRVWGEGGNRVGAGKSELFAVYSVWEAAGYH